MVGTGCIRKSPQHDVRTTNEKIAKNILFRIVRCVLLINRKLTSQRKMEINVGFTTFREGDKVMQMSNDYNLVWHKRNGFIEEEGEGVFNGDIGQIESIDFQI